MEKTNKEDMSDVVTRVVNHVISKKNQVRICPQRLPVNLFDLLLRKLIDSRQLAQQSNTTKHRVTMIMKIFEAYGLVENTGNYQYKVKQLPSNHIFLSENQINLQKQRKGKPGFITFASSRATEVMVAFKNWKSCATTIGIWMIY